MIKKYVRAVLDGLGMAVCVIDRSRNVLFINSAGQKLFGDASKGGDLDTIIKDDTFQFALDKVKGGAESSTVDVLLSTGVPVLYRVTVTRFRGSKKDEGFSAAVSFQDISHIREAQMMRSDFVANVSHELRSPLTSVYGFIETLQGSAKDDPEAQDLFLKLMQTEAQRMMRLIDDLLSLSKLQSVEHDRPTEKLDIVPLLEGVVSALAPVIEKEERPVVLKSTLLRTHVYGDPDELQQVFHNLIENGIKYSPRGSEVTVTTCTKEDMPGMLCVCVTDQGEGIAPEHIPRLTERFYRVDKGRSRTKGGTGLGLAIVKHILIRHRGELKIESKVGTGSTFAVFLPLVGHG